MPKNRRLWILLSSAVLIAALLLSFPFLWFRCDVEVESGNPGFSAYDDPQVLKKLYATAAVDMLDYEPHWLDHAKSISMEFCDPNLTEEQKAGLLESITETTGLPAYEQSLSDWEASVREDAVGVPQNQVAFEEWMRTRKTGFYLSIEPLAADGFVVQLKLAAFFLGGNGYTATYEYNPDSASWSQTKQDKDWVS